MAATEQSQIAQLVPAAVGARLDVVDLEIMSAFAALSGSQVLVSAPPLVSRPDQAPNGLRNRLGDSMRIVPGRPSVERLPRRRSSI